MLFRSAHVERVQRTLRTILSKYLFANQTRRYLDDIAKIVHTYNSRIHRSIKMSPNDAEKPEHYERLLKVTNDYLSEVKRRKAKFKVGDTVRVLLEKLPFQKGSERAFSLELFRIKSVNHTKPLATYRLETLTEPPEPIIGSWYGRQLTHYKSDNDIYLVEKVLRRRKVNGKTQYFVKWLHWPWIYNSWIDESDVVRTYNNT